MSKREFVPTAIISEQGPSLISVAKMKDPCAWPGNGGSKQRKKKSRWSANDAEKTFIPGMPTVIPADLTKDKEQQYLVHLQIEEISRRLRSGDLGIPSNPEDRSPSPEPIYNNEGKRLNTREYRTRKKLEEERHLLVQRALENNTDYKPPSDYKPPVVRVNDKVMIPQDEHPDINFVGLLIGPRGNTLKNLEKETGAKIIIRGKGSVKEGKVGRKDGQPLPGEDEPLHAYVTANNPEHVVKAVAKIKEIIKQGIEVPEGQNDLRRQQLRELALLNGTLRENDGLNKLRQLQQAQTIVTNTIVCTKCGGTGHIAQDCKMQKPGDTFRNIQPENPADKAKMDSEYMSLMAELGEGPPPPKQNEPHQHNPAASMAPAGPRPFTSPPPPMGQWRPQPPPMGATPPGIININTHQPPPPIGAQQPPPGIPSQPPMNLAPQMPPGLSSQPPVGLGPQPPPGMGMQPPPVMTSQPQLGVGAPPPPMGSQPPPTLATQLPPGIMSQTSQAVSQPLSVSAPGILAPPTISTVAGVAPPWQPAASAAPVPPPGSSPAGVGVPPPSVLAAPPPPPPSSQPPTSLPWQPSHQPVQQHNAVGVPPPPAPWQQPSNMGGAAPMMPPPPPSGMAPWQPQAHPPPPPAPVHTVASAMAPPPPPPSQPGFNAVAPPPPPPASAGLQGLGVQGGLPLGVPPPPPPN